MLYPRNAARVRSTNKRAPFLCVAEIEVVARASALREAGWGGAGVSDDGTAARDGGEAEGELGGVPSAGPERDLSPAGGGGVGGAAAAGEGVVAAGFCSLDMRPMVPATVSSTASVASARAASEGEGGYRDEESPLGPGKHLPTAAGSFALPGAQALLLEEMYGERWADKKARIRRTSVHGQMATWDLIAFIVKSNDDLRQEQFAMQLLCLFDGLFAAARTRLWLRPYQVVSTAADAGLIEVSSVCMRVYMQAFMRARMHVLVRVPMCIHGGGRAAD